VTTSDDEAKARLDAFFKRRAVKDVDCPNGNDQ